MKYLAYTIAILSFINAQQGLQLNDLEAGDNGKLEGPRRKWYSNGQLKEEGSYKNGKEDGKWTYYLEDGAIETSYDIKGNFLSRINIED